MARTVGWRRDITCGLGKLKHALPEESPDHSLALPQALALELCRDLLQQVRNLEVLRAFLQAIQAART